MQFGRVDMPMTKSTVLATLPSPLNAFKIAMTTETVGSFVQDRHTGVMGRFGAAAQMVPVTLTVHGAHGKQFHYEVLNSRSEEHTSELQSPDKLVCSLMLSKKKNYGILIATFQVSLTLS